MKTILISLGLAYMTSWIIHGKLINRIKNTRFYMHKCGYSLATAWRRAGMTL